MSTVTVILLNEIIMNSNTIEDTMEMSDPLCIKRMMS